MNLPPALARRGGEDNPLYGCKSAMGKVTLSEGKALSSKWWTFRHR
ncbi:MAG: hypothetical protein PVJ01_00270 [Pseudomonadota bacterium]|jgi:hypothetical protein